MGWAWFKVSGDMRRAPVAWWFAMEKPEGGVPDGFECNGCSCSPDWWLGRVLWLACFVHDWEYSVPGSVGTREGRRAADARFRRNLQTVLQMQGVGWFRRRRIAWLYWGRVRVWGASHYPFAPYQKPESKWQLLREAWLP